MNDSQWGTKLSLSRKWFLLNFLLLFAYKSRVISNREFAVSISIDVYLSRSVEKRKWLTCWFVVVLGSKAEVSNKGWLQGNVDCEIYRIK